MKRQSRLRGVKDLVQDAIEHGSRAVQHTHLAVAGRTFTVLEAIPPLAEPARIAHTIYDGYTSTIYEAIRLGNRGVGKLADLALDAAERE